MVSAMGRKSSKTATEWMTVPEIVEQYPVSRDVVLADIQANVLTATNTGNTTKKTGRRYRAERAEVERWWDSRRVVA